MERIILERLTSDDQGTFGIIRYKDLELYTGELPWRDNQSNVSCIPDGIYKCRWTLSARFKRYMYAVDDVPGRAGVRIHSANFFGDLSKGLYSQVNGCIAFGERLTVMSGQKALTTSAPAVRRFEMMMNKKPFELEIINGIS
jgi:hypothetical protein